MNRLAVVDNFISPQAEELVQSPRCRRLWRRTSAHDRIHPSSEEANLPDVHASRTMQDCTTDPSIPLWIRPESPDRKIQSNFLPDPGKRSKRSSAQCNHHQQTRSVPSSYLPSFFVIHRAAWALSLSRFVMCISPPSSPHHLPSFIRDSVQALGSGPRSPSRTAPIAASTSATKDSPEYTGRPDEWVAASTRQSGNRLMRPLPSACAGPSPGSEPLSERTLRSGRISCRWGFHAPKSAAFSVTLPVNGDDLRIRLLLIGEER